MYNVYLCTVVDAHHHKRCPFDSEFAVRCDPVHFLIGIEIYLFGTKRDHISEKTYHRTAQPVTAVVFGRIVRQHSTVNRLFKAERRFSRSCAKAADMIEQTFYQHCAVIIVRFIKPVIERLKSSFTVIKSVRRQIHQLLKRGQFFMFYEPVKQSFRNIVHHLRIVFRRTDSAAEPAYIRRVGIDLLSESDI